MSKNDDASCSPEHSLKTDDLTKLEKEFKHSKLLPSSFKAEISKALKKINCDIRKVRTEVQAFASDDKSIDYLQAADALKRLVLDKQAFCECTQLHLENDKIGHRHRMAKIRRELWRVEERLPALGSRLAFTEALASHDFVVVVGDNGCGKSTQLPQYIVDMPQFSGTKVLCTQPRRIAAVELCKRVAHEFAAGDEKTGQIGHYVGFQIGGLSCTSERYTQIEYLTEGILVQQIATKLSAENAKTEPQQQPKDDDDKEATSANKVCRRIKLEECSVIIVDEVHERNINTDLLLGLLKTTKHFFPSLKIVVSSATMNAQKFSDFFGNCPIIVIPGRTFPIDIRYEPTDFGDRFSQMANKIAEKAYQIVKETPDDVEGGILAFLTGMAEVENAKSAFIGLVRRYVGNPEKFSVHALYGRQTPEEQQQTVENLPPGVRRVIFATDVAETSLTIEKVRYVIDPGYTKDLFHTGKNNESYFVVVKISKSSAQQRAGRAGRMSAGVCYRLYSQDTFDKLQAFPDPEVHRKPLGTSINTLLSLGINPFTFEWPDKPDARIISDTINELIVLGAVEPLSLKTTAIGKAISAIQMEPPICRMLYAACQQGLARSGLILGAFMRVSNAVLQPGSLYLKAHRQAGDFVAAYRAYLDWKSIKDEALKLENLPNVDIELAAEILEDDVDDSFFETAYESEEEEDTVAQVGDADSTKPKLLSAAMQVVLDAMPVPQAVKDWCECKLVNCSLMVLADLECQTIERRLRSTGLWDLHERNEDTDFFATDEQLQKLILQALYTNIGFYEPFNFQGRTLWRCLLPVSGDMADFGRRTLFNKADANSFRPPLWCIVFHESFTPMSQQGLCLERITPVQFQWLTEMSPNFGAWIWGRYNECRFQINQIQACAQQQFIANPMQNSHLFLPMGSGNAPHR